MSDFVDVCLLFAGLCASFLTGRVVHRILPESHRTHETLDFVRTTSGLLVTFTALMLGLLLAAVNEDFRKTNADLEAFGASITLLDAELAGLGPASEPMRAELRRYTAAAVATTWPDEPAPEGAYPRPDASGAEIDSAALSALLHRIEGEIRRFTPRDAGDDKAQAACLSVMASLLGERGALIGDAHSAVTPFFFGTMVFWLTIVFFSFGLTAPRNRTTTAFVATVAVVIASAVFLISELDGPLTGVIKVGSDPLRQALRRMDGPEPPAP